MMSDLDVSAKSIHSQPQNFDAVLGDRKSIVKGSIVLGGIEGIKARLSSDRPSVVILALQDAINYGEAGLRLVLPCLEDSDSQIVDTAYELLKYRSEPFVRDRIDRYLDDRELEIQDLKYSWLESSSADAAHKQFKTNKATKNTANTKNWRPFNKPSKKRWNSAS
jgi:hypothetical protein